MVAQVTVDTPKPPALHQRSDVFHTIAMTWNGGNDLELVQERFRGALMMLDGTAIPKEHEMLAASVGSNASLIEIEGDPLVTETVAWIESERKRHAKPAAETTKSASPSTEDLAPYHALGANPRPDSGLPSDTERHD